MPDDKPKRGARYRDRVPGDQACEVEYFARKHDISIEQARQLINEHGNNRAMLEATAQIMKWKGAA
jgi:Protein of unknown function (DUF3606)